MPVPIAEVWSFSRPRRLANLLIAPTAPIPIAIAIAIAIAKMMSETTGRSCVSGYR